MAFWLPSNYTPINIGSAPNDGTGDDVRTAFSKVDNNFANISTQLGNISQNFVNVSVSTNLISGNANLTNLITANIIGNTASFTGNVTAGNLIANTQIVGLNGATIIGTANYAGNVNVTGNLNVVGTSYHVGNTYIAGPVIPSANISYDLGSPTNYFRNIYSQGVIQVNTVSASSDAGLLQIHANLTPGDNKDVGIFGKYYDTPSASNLYSFFGRQNSSNNFVFISGVSLNAAAGNSIVVGGFYGNVQFGSQWVSNTTISNSTTSGALVVAGGAGIAGNVYAGQFVGNITTLAANVTSMTVANSVAGNLHVDGNIFSGAFQVLTTGTQGIGNVFNGNGSLFLGNTVFASAIPSTSVGTGAVILSNGGLGVFGNVNAGALYGPYYGNVMTNAQPYITSLGTLTGLTSTTGSFNSVTSITAQITGLATLSGGTTTTTITATSLATLTGGVTTAAITASGLAALNAGATTTTLTASGNITAANVNASYYGNIMSNAQPNITSVGTLGNLTVSGNLFGRLSTNAQPNITSVGTLANLTVSGNLFGTLTTAAQPNITSVGALTALGVTGAVTASSITVAGTGGITLASTGDIAAYRAGGTTGVIYLNQAGTRYLFNDSANYNLVGQGLVVGGAITASGEVIANNAVTAILGTAPGQLQAVGNSGANWYNVMLRNDGASAYLLSSAVQTTQNAATNATWNGLRPLQWNLATGAVSIAADGATTIVGGFLQAGSGINATGAIFANNNGAQTTEGDIGAGAVGQNNAYLYNHGSAWGLYSVSGGSPISYIRGTNSTTLNSASGYVYSTAHIAPTTNGTLNLGAVGNYWATIYGTSTTALYADLAENYAADAKYAPGTVVIFGGAAEITTTSEAGDERVAGAISTNPAHLMNGGLIDGLPVALRGRIPCNVIGPVAKGDSLVTSTTPGYAMSVGRNRSYGQSVFAKALETDLTPGTKTITVVIL